MWKLDERMNFSRYVYAFKFDVLCFLEKLISLYNENDPPKHPKDKQVGNNVSWS